MIQCHRHGFKQNVFTDMKAKLAIFYFGCGAVDGEH